MIMRRLERRKAREPLPDALLALAGSLSTAAREDALDLLSRALTERDIPFALLVQSGDGLRLERATLPFEPAVWGRALLLPKLTAAIGRNRPLIENDAATAFTEASGRSSLLASPVIGTLVVAPLSAGAAVSGVLAAVLRDPEEHDRLAVWALALGLGAALRGLPEATAPPAPRGDDATLFHELTRRLSYSLNQDEAVRAGLETLAPSVAFRYAVAVFCRDGLDAVTLYGPPQLGPNAAEIAGQALDTFRGLTGERHRSCESAPVEVALLSTREPPNRAGAAEKLLDAPLVIEGQVAGLLRIGAAPAALDGASEALFYTVANQVSLALERAAVQRRAERAHLASLAESLNDGIVLVDAGLRVTSLNNAARAHLGSFAPDIAEGLSIAETPLAPVAREALSGGEPTDSYELPAAPHAPARRYLVAMAAPLAGSPEGSAAVVIVRDVTEERLMQERLLQSEKMVSVGQLVSGVAHELNNPLTGIMGFTQLLMARKLDEGVLRDLETIYTEAERASKVVQNLLSFARRKRTDKELSDINALIERVLELRNYDLRVKNIDVELDLDPRLPQTMVDPDQIQQVFLNLIINAEQAMIAASGEGKLKVRSQRKGDLIRLSLQDDGPGMEPETLRRIFDPFFTTKQAGEGTGLGLTISYGIIDEHNGRIWADSTPGRGTTFIIELPVVQGQGKPALRPVDEPENAVTARSILVVDDEESIQRLLGSLLEMDGHHVDTARNGEEALERIGRRRYDVVITDIKMPDMDGPSLYRRLQQLDAGLARRTVFITGDTVSPDTRRFLQDVPNPCLAKPFKVREVRDTIQALLEE